MKQICKAMLDCAGSLIDILASRHPGCPWNLYLITNFIFSVHHGGCDQSAGLLLSSYLSFAFTFSPIFTFIQCTVQTPKPTNTMLNHLLFLLLGSARNYNSTVVAHWQPAKESPHFSLTTRDIFPIHFPIQSYTYT